MCLGHVLAPMFELRSKARIENSKFFNQKIEYLHFQDLNNYLQEGYLLVIELFRDMLRHLD